MAEILALILTLSAFISTGIEAKSHKSETKSAAQSELKTWHAPVVSEIYGGVASLVPKAKAENGFPAIS